MPGIRPLFPSWWNRRRIVLAVAVAAVLALLSTALLARPSVASEQHGLQTVHVRVGADATVHAVSTASVVADEDGRVSETRVDLEPAEAVDHLPVRVQTAWWHDGAAGTDLAELEGRSGRFVLQVSVHDLTAEASELTFETGGAQYRQQALVGVPLTVVAGAEVGGGDRVVQVADGEDDDHRVTDGVLVETPDAGRSVQWAAFLAPPMLSPTADFTLVVDTRDFRVPAFDITVHPGLVTDPSVAALLDRAYGADGYSARLEGATIALVQNVSSRLTEALEFVDQVHEALQRDVADLGERTYRDLGSSSTTVLGHLEATAADLDGILGTASAGIGEVGSQTHSGVQALSRSLGDILGSTGVRPELTATVVQGCSLTMPSLAAGAERTVSSTVHVADAQLRAIVALFDDGRDAPPDGCRSALHRLLQSTIGDPSVLDDPTEAAACRATPADQRTVACTLAIAREVLSADLAALALRQDDVLAHHARLGVSELAAVLAGPHGLAATLTDLRDQLSAASSDSGSTRADVLARARAAQTAIARARAATASARTGLDGVDAALGGLVSARDALHASLLDGTGSVRGALEGVAAAAGSTVDVGRWFAGSRYADGLDNLVVRLNAGAGADVCAPDWADGLGAGSSAGDIAAALARLDVPACPAGALAVATSGLVTGYAGTIATVDGMAAQVGGGHGSLDAVEQGLADLDAAIGDLQVLTDASSALSVELRALDDADSGGGLLADLADATAELAALAADGGELGDLDARLAGLAETVTSIWPDDRVQPVEGTSTCRAVQPSPDRRPEPVAQGVVWLGNRLLCLEADLGRLLHALDAQIAGTAAASDAELQRTAGRTQDARDRGREEIDALSSGLVEELTVQRESATASSLEMVEQSRTQARTQMDQVLDGYDLASSRVLQQLTDAMQRSSTESTAVAGVLAAGFADLLANLGSPDPTSRGGMLGKLHAITTQVGETGTVLDVVGGATAAHGSVRSGELRDLDLRAAQHAASEERLAGYRPFADLEDDLETVFVFQLRAVR